MANRAYFINHSEDSPVSLDIQRGQWLLAASYQIPILWLALFSEIDIKIVATRMQDANGNEIIERVPTLVSRVSKAVQRYQARRSVLAAAIPESYHPHIEEWEAFISASLPLLFVQLEMTEIRIMNDPQQFDVVVSDYLAAFSAASHPGWDALCSQAALGRPEVARYGLRGYPWHSEVAWK